MRFMRNKIAVILVLAFSVPATTIFSRTQSIGLLFQGGPDSQTVQRGWEEKFRAVPAPESAREHLRRLTAVPHVAGTKEDYATAVYVRDQIRSYGIPSELKEYD